MNAHVDDIKQRRRALEAAIESAVKFFEETTELEVNRIDLLEAGHPELGGTRKVIIRVEVLLPRT
jgi:hypothetical protein